MDIEFESEDPAICQNTLLILCEVFIKLNADIKANQSDAVVKYFERQLAYSTDELNEAEEKLLGFNQSNNIINYYEQTKHIAAEKEEFDIKYLEISRDFFATKAVLGTLEARLEAHELKRISSQRIMGLREELSSLNFEISMLTLGVQKDSVELERDVAKVNKKQKEVARIERELTSTVDSLYKTDYDTKSLASTTILSDWLKKTIEFEETKAKLLVMDEKRLEFDKLYQEFSPLGATLKKLERKIDIAEREYLSLLHSLGLAKLRQQNVELKSNIKLTEVPFFPINPKPSKRKLLIYRGRFGGLHSGCGECVYS